MADKSQTFANHGRFDPLFHFFLVPVFGLGLIMSVIHFVAHLGENVRADNLRDNIHAALLILLATAFLLAILKIRMYALRNQDRIIRLEERLRLATLLPEALRSRIPELTEDQLIAIRFASDAEVPALVERTLSQKLSRKDIKKLIQNWRPDDSRI